MPDITYEEVLANINAKLPDNTVRSIRPVAERDAITQVLVYAQQEIDKLKGLGKPILFTIGDGGDLTPEDGDTAYRNPLLAGMDITIERNGEGYLVGAGKYVRVDTEDESGFDLTGGALFNEGEVYAVKAYQPTT